MDKTDVITESELQQSMYPGFSIQCSRCGSKRVTVENTLGCSPESGWWGSPDLLCLDCGAFVTLYDWAWDVRY